MQKNMMSISVNGQSQVPPGFRFYPTEEELVHYYLRKKISYNKIDLDVIRDVDLNKLEPWDIKEMCKIGTTPQNEWYFFSHNDKKYPTGTRTNRATEVGYWKATGRDKVIYSNGKRIGLRKTLVFYKGRARRGQKSDWIMHEYRLDNNTAAGNTNVMSNWMGDVQREGWVVCKIFKQKNFLKTPNSALVSSISTEAKRSHLLDSCGEGTLEQILYQQIGRGNNNKENYEGNCTFDMGLNNGNNHDKFMNLPTLDININNNGYHHPAILVEMGANYEGSLITHQMNSDDPNIVHPTEGGCLSNWAALDRMIAYQLNGQTEICKQSACFNDIKIGGYCTNDHDLQLPMLQSSSSSSKSILNRLAARISPTLHYTRL